jgi:23S rRNA pseudouridine955/2504/2580 synthase
MSEQQKIQISQGVQRVVVDEEHAGQRLDNFLLAKLKGLPRSRVYRLCRKGEVRVNKGRVKPDYRLCEGDEVRIPPVSLPVPNAIPKVGNQLSELLLASILYEDDSLLVINKPSGIAVHGGSGINLGLIEALRQIRPDDRHLELVHRLDRDTSGCLMIARKRSALRMLHAALREKHVKKRYLALVEGNWPKGKTEVRAPLLKNNLQSGERMVRVDSEGKSSHTKFRVLSKGGGTTLLEASPITGRTHQIRVHAQFAGHPLIGDVKYGRDDVNKTFKKKGCKRLFLHAYELELPLLSGDKITVKAELPHDLSEFLSTIHK